jgi:hypothetical protein
MASRAFKPEPEEKSSEHTDAGNCEERLALRGKYNIAASLSAQCSAELRSRSDVCSKSELEQIRHRAENAVRQLDMAFDELEQHVTQHGCSGERSHHLLEYHEAPEELPENGH